MSLLVDELWLDTDGGSRRLLPRAEPPAVWVQACDLGHAEVRERVTSRSEAHGDTDDTSFYGGRGVTLKFAAFDAAAFSELLALLDVPDRPVLRWRLTPTGSWRRLTVRRGAIDGAIVAERRSDHFVIDVALRAADGLARGDAHKESLEPGEPFLGIGFPWSFPLSFPSTGALGSLTVQVGGDARAPWVALIHGPAENPVIVHADLDARLAFIGNVDAGSWLEVDSAERTVLEQGNPAADRSNLIDYAVSDWFDLRPKDNTLQFLPAASSPPSQLELRWDDRYQGA